MNNYTAQRAQRSKDCLETENWIPKAARGCLNHSFAWWFFPFIRLSRKQQSDCSARKCSGSQYHAQWHCVNKGEVLLESSRCSGMYLHIRTGPSPRLGLDFIPDIVLRTRSDDENKIKQDNCDRIQVIRGCIRKPGLLQTWQRFLLDSQVENDWNLSEYHAQKESVGFRVSSGVMGC